MLTLLVLFIGIIAIVLIFGIIVGLLSVLWPILIIIAFLVIDYFVLKMIFKRKKKKG